MTFDVFFTYLISVIVLTASPGPMVLLSMKHGVEHGVSGSILSSFTGMICICFMIILCFFGVSQILQSNFILRNALLISGVIYIFYLGLMSILQSSNNMIFSALKKENSKQDKLKIIREMSVIAWTNPKDWIFFGLFLPQFINEKSELLPQLIIIIITFAICEFFFLSVFGSFSYFFISMFNKYIKIYKKIIGLILIIVAFLMGYHTINSSFLI